MTVGSASYMTGLFRDPLDVARGLVPDDYFTVAEIFPDEAVFFVGTGEFREAGIGPYKELYVGFYTENREQGTRPTREENLAEFSANGSKMYMWKNWVTTDAALDKMDRAGSTVFRRGEIERKDLPERTCFEMNHAEEGVVRFTVPTRSDLVQSNFSMERTHYGRLRGEPSRCLLDLEIDDMMTTLGQGELVLEGRIAEECASLELPAQPMVSIWIGEMRFDMHKALQLLAAGAGQGD